MIELIPTLELIAIAIGGLALVACLSVYSAFRSQATQIRKLRRMVFEESEARRQIELDFGALLQCSKNLGRRINDQDKEVSRRKHHGVSLNQEDDGTGERVHKLLDKGLTIDEIASICSLTRGEVEFLSHFATAPAIKPAPSASEGANRRALSSANVAAVA